MNDHIVNDFMNKVQTKAKPSFRIQTLIGDDDNVEGEENGRRTTHQVQVNSTFFVLVLIMHILYYFILILNVALSLNIIVSCLFNFASFSLIGIEIYNLKVFFSKKIGLEIMHFQKSKSSFK